MKMKIKDFLNFYIGFNSFQIATESGDRFTSPLTKDQAINAYGKAELKGTEAECIDTALLNLVCMYERQTILDENEYQEYKKAYRAFDDVVCKTVEKQTML